MKSSHYENKACRNFSYYGAIKVESDMLTKFKIHMIGLGLIFFFLFRSLALADVCSEATCPSTHRYELACSTEVLDPTFLFSYDPEDVYEGKLFYVGYSDGKDLSFSGDSWKISEDGVQVMKGIVSDLRPNLAYIPVKGSEDELTWQIYVLADEWDCDLYDNGPGGTIRWLEFQPED